MPDASVHSPDGSRARKKGLFVRVAAPPAAVLRAAPRRRRGIDKALENCSRAGNIYRPRGLCSHLLSCGGLFFYSEVIFIGRFVARARYAEAALGPDLNTNAGLIGRVDARF